MTAGFANPWLLLLLLPLLPGVFWLYRRRRAHSLLYSSLTLLPPQHARTWRHYAVMLLPAIFIAGLAMMILALARPRSTLTRITRTRDVVAIYMVVDTSGSMEALDMSIMRDGRIITERTRLDAVKEEFTRFIERRPDDLIGLISFAGYAYTRAPLTSDHRAIMRVLDDVKLPTPVRDARGQVVNQAEFMTAIGDALATACARMQDVEVATRIIVLLSDGESNYGIIEPEAATQMAQTLGIRVYSIGVGVPDQAAPIRRTDRFGRSVITHAQYEMDEAALRRIAEKTGGRYFSAYDAQGLEKAITAIDELERTTVQEDVYEEYDEWFARLLWPGTLLVFFAMTMHAAITRHAI